MSPNEAGPTIVTVSGASRPGSYTAMALAVVNDELQKRGIEVSYLDARELKLNFPGQPSTEDGERLREAIASATGVVLATPEYHGSFSALTKLVIENLGFPSVLAGKPVALLGVAAGRIGAIKSLEHLRGVCAHTGAVVMPQAVSIAGVRNAFDEGGRSTDSATEEALRSLAAELQGFLRDYVCPREILEAMVRDGGEAWPARV